VASVVSGLALTSGTESSRWLGVLVAAIYGLFTHGEEVVVASLSSRSETSERDSRDSEMPADTSSLGEQARRAA
jgi:hypothetical protein